MPYNPTPQDLIKSAAEIAQSPAKLTAKLRILRKYSLLGPLMPDARLGGIVMFHAGRSGSSVLASLLDQHPQVYWGQEIYLPHFKAVGVRTRMDVDPLALLNRASRWVGRRYFGFEVKFWHLHQTGVALDDYLDVLRDFGVQHFIILERKNLLRRLVSSQIGSTHKRMVVKKSEATSLLTIELPVQHLEHQTGESTLIEYLEQQQANFERLRTLLASEQVLELSSAEDIFPNPVRGYERVCDFVGLKAAPAEVPTRRVNPYPLQAMLSNFAEVEAALQNTPFEWMLYDTD